MSARRTRHAAPRYAQRPTSQLSAVIRASAGGAGWSRNLRPCVYTGNNSRPCSGQITREPLSRASSTGRGEGRGGVDDGTASHINDPLETLAGDLIIYPEKVKVENMLHLHCTSSRQRSSSAESGMAGFSARHVRYLPSSSMVGEKPSTLTEWLPSAENCTCTTEQKASQNNGLDDKVLKLLAVKMAGGIQVEGALVA